LPHGFKISNFSVDLQAINGKLTLLKSSPEAKFKQAIQTTSKVMDRLPELPAMMDNASKALELLAAGTVATNNEIAKKFEYEKLKIKNQQNNIIIFMLLLIILLLIILN